MDEAVFAGVASRGDGWVMKKARGLGVTGLGGKGAGLLWWGWGLLLGSFRVKHNYYIALTMTLNNRNRNVHFLTSANHMRTSPPGSTLRMGGSYCEMG